MRSARSIVTLAAMGLVLALAPANVVGQETKSRSINGDGDALQTEIRPASQTVSDRQRERRRRGRDRARRRFVRGSAELQPHFGDYTVHETGFSTSRFKRAHGTLSVELINDCEDWTLQEKWDLDLRDQADASHRSNLLYRASEERSADKFVFAYSRDHLGERTDYIGNVIEVGGGYMARYRVPKIADVFLTPDLIFPISHLRQILSEARRQRTGFEAITFDGGNEFAYRAVTTIDQPLDDNNRTPSVVAARTELDRRTSDRLPEGRHWPVHIDYFPLDDAYAPPVFTREFLLHENGIVLSFHFDYGDIQMDARLKHLDIREAIACPNE